MMSTNNYLESRDSSPVEFKVQRPLLTTSILGRFVRKCRLEYIKLDYDEAELLWSLFNVSRASTSEYMSFDEGNTTGEESGIYVQESLQGPIGS
jgi:hypothetical protein